MTKNTENVSADCETDLLEVGPKIDPTPRTNSALQMQLLDVVIDRLGPEWTLRPVTHGGNQSPALFNQTEILDRNL